MIRLRRRDRAADGARALDAANELFGAGRELDAIKLLTKANAAARDARLEQRLIDMRAEAFRRMNWPQPGVNVPGDCPDLFPGAIVPEVSRKDLDVEHVRSAIANHGCLLVRGLVDARSVPRLIDDIDLALEAYDAFVAAGYRDTGTPRFVPFAGERGPERKFRRDVGSVLAVDSPPALFDVIEAFEAAGIGQLVQSYFGERPALLAKKWTLRCVSHEAGPSSWHQDGAFMGGDIRSLNVWLALSHCGDDAPGLDIVARRLDRVVPTGTDGAYLDWTVGEGMVERVAEGSVTRPIFEPGDALIFDHLNLHRTAVDPGMTRDRYAIEAWFLAPSTYATMIAGGESGTSPPRDQVPLVY